MSTAPNITTSNFLEGKQDFQFDHTPPISIKADTVAKDQIPTFDHSAIDGPKKKPLKERICMGIGETLIILAFLCVVGLAVAISIAAPFLAIAIFALGVGLFGFAGAIIPFLGLSS